MGLYSNVDEPWTCPFCGERQNDPIQFKYGLRNDIYYYKVGDKIRWGSPTQNFPEGPPNAVTNGTGVIRGLVGCKNTWKNKFPNYDPDRHYRLEPRTLEEIKKLGCPDLMNICIEINDFIVRKVFFPQSLEEIFDDV